MTGGETSSATDEGRGRLRFDEGDLAAGARGRASLVLTALAVGLYAAARLWRLTSHCLWFDEIFSLHAARHGWPEMLRFTAADVIHPPLFYALLKVWTAAGGESLLWLRLLPALTSIACVAPLLLLCRELKVGAAETNLALLLMASSGYLIKYAQELRMYSLLLLLTLSSLWLFARFFNGERPRRTNSSALFFANLLLAYTHYYGWLVVFAELAFLLLRGRHRLRQFLVSLAALAACFAPWVVAVLRSAERGRGLEQNIGWVARPGAAQLAEFFALLHVPFYFRQSSGDPLYARWSAAAALALFGVPLAALLWRRLGRGTEAARQNGLRLLLVCSLLPVALAFALSWVLPQSVWGTRHLIVAAAPYLLLASAAVVRLRPEWLKTTVLCAIGCWLFLAAFAALARRERPPVWCAWEHLSAHVLRDEGTQTEGVTVFAFEDLVAYHLWFALDEPSGRKVKVAVVRGLPGVAEDPAYFLPRAFDGVAVGDASTLEGARFWVAFRGAALDETLPPLNALKERGYRVGRVFEFDAQGQKAFLVEAVK